MFTSHEIAKRQPVWEALSNLWIDMELTDVDLDWIVKECLTSGYTVEELTDIYHHEVAPAVYQNLYQAAGEWAGFNGSWLREQIIEAERRRTALGRWWLHLPLMQYMMTWMTHREWQYILQRIQESQRLA